MSQVLRDVLKFLLKLNWKVVWITSFFAILRGSTARKQSEYGPFYHPESLISGCRLKGLCWD